MFDAIVVGSGPGGTHCARGLRGLNVLLLDVGRRPERPWDLPGTLAGLRGESDDLFAPLIGERFEGLRHLRGGEPSLKLKAPGMAYVVAGWEELTPAVAEGFDATISLAEGGLANAWGGGAYRFDDADLAGWPIRAADLAPHYDELTRFVGVSGENDDLAPCFGRDEALQPPLPLSRFFAGLQRRCRERRGELEARGIRVGRPRLAVLTREHRGRAPYSCGGLDFFRPHDPALYNPAFTLRELAAAGAVDYRPGFLVLRYRESPGRVEVLARNIATGETEVFPARRLFLGAGALNSARIVLASRDDHESRLPLLDNPMSLLPILRPALIGAAPEECESALAQLNLVWDEPVSGRRLQASLYGTAGALRSDILLRAPLPVTAALSWARTLSPALAVAMLFYPGVGGPGNHLRLGADGALRLRHEAPVLGAAERRLAAAFRSIGYPGVASLCQYPRIGAGMHYAGTLPMRERPGRYETDAAGRLGGAGRVHVVDGGILTTLPAKNLTFTIMANAERIARLARESPS